ncbi:MULTISPECIES: hypothetical protein [Acidiphilium]|uniref:hypothetical protein n=1 Tax=Acidiphilium TaxID=522 RepID=UPI00257AD2EE|nr:MULTISPECIES: hypothetical protein [Acidiphilium]HQT86615.1 hypothetical protein [Acidiphilium rubrum]
MNETIIPAAAGAECLLFLRPLDGVACMTRRAVVAWRVTSEGAVPVLVGNREDGPAQRGALLWHAEPDGLWRLDGCFSSETLERAKQISFDIIGRTE